MKDNWDNNWSEYIKSTLDEYCPPVPDDLWNNLEGKLPVSKPSIFLTSKFILSSILSICIIVGVYFLSTDKDRIADHKFKEQIHTIDTIKNNKTVKPNLQLAETETETETKLSTSTKQLYDMGEADAASFILKPSDELIKQQAIAQQQSSYDPITNKKQTLALQKMLHKRIKIKVDKKKRIKKEFNLSIESGIQYFESINFTAGIRSQFNWNRLGIYGGIHYSPNQLSKFISGEGTENSTVKVLTASETQHRLSFLSGLSYHILNAQNKRLSVNAGILSKTISLNGNSSFYNPFMVSTGVEYHIAFLRKYKTGVYYNYLFVSSGQNTNGHQFGVRFTL